MTTESPFSKSKKRCGPRSDISRERLLELCTYNPESGVFLWNHLPGKGRGRGGQGIGWIDDWGYVRAEFDAVAYRLHRLAWLYMTGEWPSEEIDHIDGDPANNAWSNLRQATRVQNSQNTKIRANNTSGVKGVSRHPQCDRWMARVGAGKRRHYLGIFLTKDEAEQAVREFRQVAHKEFARHE